MEIFLFVELSSSKDKILNDDNKNGQWSTHPVTIDYKSQPWVNAISTGSIIDLFFIPLEYRSIGSS